MIETLVKLGNWLQGIDEVQEYNGMGFNKFDWGRWSNALSANNPYRMASILAKYKRQILAQWGESDYQVVVANLPTEGLKVSAVGTISPINYIKDFKAYVTLVKQHGCRFLPTTKEWQAQKGFQIDAFLADAHTAGFEVLVDQGFDPNAAEEAAKAADEAKRVVRVAARQDGTIEFSCGAFSEMFNRIFSNKTGLLTGITEYEPDTHARLTRSVRLAEEAIAKIAARMPDFKIAIQDSFKYAVAHQNAMDEADKTAIPEITAVLAQDIKLFAHQNRAVQFLADNNGNGLLGACMGSGKTAMALAWAAMNGKRVLVICPKVVRRTWVQEAKKFFPTVFANATELKNCRLPSFAEISLVSVNYESIDKYLNKILDAKFDLLIVDESHCCKNPKAKRTRQVTEISKTIQHKILLSGTAIKNDREELFPQIDMIQPGRYTSSVSILKMTIGHFWHDISDVYLPMAKADVLAFLPTKTQMIVAQDVTNPTRLPESVEEVATCKVAAALSKVDATIEYLENVMENSDSKVLVFSDSMEVVQAIHAHFGGLSILHHGQLSDNVREKAKEDFQNPEDPRRIFVSTRQSLAVGATLTAANVVLFNDLPWTPADIAQAEDRTHRIGQHKPVTVVWMTAENSDFDTHLCNILRRKYALCKAVNEGKQVSDAEREWMSKPVTFADLIAA